MNPETRRTGGLAMDPATFRSDHVPARHLRGDDREVRRPVFVVWELTLACDLACAHCGSRAGSRRPNELSTEECLDVVKQFAAMGVREVTVIGGEAYLRKDWLTIIAAIADAGIRCTMQTGARNLTVKRIRQAKDAGLAGAGVSVDGMEELHDSIRCFPGSWQRAIQALHDLADHGLLGGANTAVSPALLPELRDVFEVLAEAQVKNWALSPMVAMGRAADNVNLLLQPYELLELFDILAELDKPALGHGMRIEPANSLGYFGPTEALWRGARADQDAWMGCPAGQNGMSLESDGTFKGCPSLPTVEYSGGSVRDRRIEDMWHTSPEVAFNSGRTVDDLWGFCRTCYYAEPCLGGCTWVSHSLFGRPGNNPMCHYRALELKKQGLRERIAPKASAPGTSFDHGEFELILEPFDSPDPSPLSSNGDLPVIAPPAVRHASEPASQAVIPLGAIRREAPPAHRRPPRQVDGRVPGRRAQPLQLCRGCHQYVKYGATTCAHCGADIAAARARYEKLEEAALEAAMELQAVMSRRGGGTPGSE